MSRVIKYIGFEPSKRLGQHFLTDKLVVKRVFSAAKITAKDVVLEIGPGTGVLTKKIVRKAKKVIAIEKDPRMVEMLRETLKDSRNVEIVRGDILRLNPAAYAAKIYKVVANPPFYLAVHAIRKLLEAKAPPQEMTLIVQKEVAQRICAKAPKINLLAVSVQFYATPKIISYIPRTAFWPRPKVDTAIVKLKIKNLKFEISSKDFFRVVRAGFSQPRKQIVNNLSKGLKLNKEKVRTWLRRTGVKPESRAESLGLETWIALAKGCIIK